MDKNNKYLFIIRSLTGGGAERVVSVLSSHMAENGYDVNIIAYSKSESDYIFSSKVKIFYMPKEPDTLIGKLKRIGDMRELMKIIKPDIIFPFVGTVLFVSFIASRPENTPFIRTIRNSPWNEPGNRVEKLMRKILNQKATAIMVQNEEQIEYFPIKMQNKIFEVPNPIADVFVTQKKEIYSHQIKRIVTVGRLTMQKNHEMMIRAFGNIAPMYPDVILEIYGQGKERERLQSLIDTMNLGDKCFLKGRNDNIAETLMESDLFVMSSNFEGMPNALMEAMVVGVPCISSDCKTGPKSLIQHGKTGLLFTTGNDQSLIDSMKWALKNTEEMNQMGRCAHNHIVENYSSKVAFASLLKMIDSI